MSNQSNHWNSPAEPHLGHKKPKRWPWILLSIVVVVGLGVGVLSFAVAKKRSEVAARQSAFEGPVSVTPPPPPPKPGAPVSCRPDKPRSTLTCFPADIRPDTVLDGVAGDVGWQCLHHGEQDSDGNPVREPRRCQGINNVDQPYRLKQSITYETWDYQPASAVKSITLDASASAAAHKGQHATRQDATGVLMDFFVRANPHIWQGKPQLQEEAAATFEQLKARCSTREGQSIAGASATTPSGYQIECNSPAGGIATGDVTTYEQQIKVTAK